MARPSPALVISPALITASSWPVQLVANTVALTCNSGRRVVLVDGSDTEAVLWELSVGRGVVRLVRGTQRGGREGAVRCFRVQCEA